MNKKLFVLLLFIAGFCGCTKPLIETPPDVPKLPGGNNSLFFPLQKIDFTNSDTTIVFGDSWCDNGFDPNNFTKIFADSSRQTIFNTAATGFGSGNMVSKAYETMNTVHNHTNVIALCGFNDVRFWGATTEQLNFQKNAYRTLLVNQFVDTWRPAGSPSRRGGSFTSIIQPLTPHFKSFYSTGYKAAYTSSVNGVYLEYDFTGTNVGVSFVGQDTTAMASYEQPHGRWRVLIDGVVIDTPQIHQQTQGHIPGYMAPQKIFPYIRIYSGLTAGGHVLRLEPIEAGNKFVDFIFTLRDPDLVRPVTILEIPYMTQAGYFADPSANKGSDAAIDLINNAIAEVREEFTSIDPKFSKKIKIIPTAKFFDKNTDYMHDLIHPNTGGKTNLFKALKAHVNY